jgi:hypothetical protein
VKKFEKVLKEFEFKSLDLIEFEKKEKEPHLPFRPSSQAAHSSLPRSAPPFFFLFFFFFLCVADTPVM